MSEYLFDIIFKYNLEEIFLILVVIVFCFVFYWVLERTFRDKKRSPTRDKQWRDRIKDAERQGRFTCQDKDNAKDWDINAVGERLLIEGYSIKPVGTNIGSELRDMGHELYDAVEADNISEAKRLYTEIHKLITRRKSAYSYYMHTPDDIWERVIREY